MYAEQQHLAMLNLKIKNYQNRTFIHMKLFEESEGLNNFELERE